ncbi:MAG: HDOD domain-containing protein [Nitrospirae bacterium]|nr:MAG: HDOD domain-containing protein [Nitrospirota bacterium]
MDSTGIPDQMLPPELQARLRQCTTLPSPPKVAVKIIELAKDPEVDIEDVVRVLMIDPALSAKILRMANSPLYGHQKKVKDLTKATMVIGFNGVLSLALSFSLIKTFRREEGAGLNHLWFWRRAIMNGAACRTLGEACHRKDLEQLFTPAFLQDIGMLVLDQIDPALYAHLNLDRLPHQRLVDYEMERLGTTHATVGAWLLAQWHCPEELVQAIDYSDRPHHIPPQTDQTLFFHCVACSGMLTDLCTTEPGDEQLVEISEYFQTTLNLASLAFLEVLKKVQAVGRELGSLFGIDTADGEHDPHALFEKARELLVLRNIGIDQQLKTLTAQV